MTDKHAPAVEKRELSCVLQARKLRLALAVSLMASVGISAWVGGADLSFAQSGDGYAGVLAPSKPSDKGPAGYAGVVPGYVAPAQQPTEDDATQTPSTHKKQAAGESDTADTPELPSTKLRYNGNKIVRPVVAVPENEDVTKIPGTNLPRRAASVAQLNSMALKYKFDKNGNGVFDKVEDNRTEISDSMKLLLAKPRRRIDGMMPMEWDAKTTIESYTPGITAEDMSPAEKRAYLKGVYSELDEMASGIRYILAVPEDVERKMGMPDLYIKEKREDHQKALKRLEEALVLLEKML